MMEKIIIIPDSFKNTMESKEVASIIKEVLLENDPQLDISMYPIADGGEGTAKIFSDYLGLELKKMTTTNAFGKEIEIEYGTNGKIAVIDIASIVGFGANEGEILNPSITTTFGIGEVLKKLMIIGHNKIYVGLGGSITNDLGLGMVSALGVKFYDKNGENFVPVGKTFSNIYNIDIDEFLCDCEIICLSDVKSPLFGPTGAARMFAKQKGADDEMVNVLEEEGKKAVKIINNIKDDFSLFPGSGAAGGLGYSFKTFLDAEIRSGIDEILKISNVENEITKNTILITGEGKFDKQSIQGKVISGIVKMAKNKKARVMVVAGCVEEGFAHEDIECVFACSEMGRDIEEIKKTCHEDLKKATKEVYKYIKRKM